MIRRTSASDVSRSHVSFIITVAWICVLYLHSVTSFRIGSYGSSSLLVMSGLRYEGILSAEIQTHYTASDAFLNHPHTHNKPVFATKLSQRKPPGAKLTRANKKHLELGLKLRSQYKRLRLLEKEEEITAGKFSHIGKRLHSIKAILVSRLGREPSRDEWASAANISVHQLPLYQQLSAEARNKLVQHNIRIVDHWVRYFLENTKGSKQVSYYELMAEGIVGLTKAAEQYDGRGRFYQYAYHYVKSALYEGISTLRPGVLASHRTITLSNRARKIGLQLKHTLNRPPTDEEIAEKLNMRVGTLKFLRETSGKRFFSAQTQLGGNQVMESTGVTSNNYFDCYQKADQSITTDDKSTWKSEFLNALDCLTETEKRIVGIRFGLVDGDQMTIERTAELMCMSSESIRIIMHSALEKLRLVEELKNGLNPQRLENISRLAAFVY